MAVSSKNYRVGLILSTELGITDYVLSVGNQKCNVCFYSTVNPEKYCDLVITDKKPNELSTIPIQQKDCHGTTLVINQISNPLLERQYESIFTKVVSLKYKSINKQTNKTITKLINAELVKRQVKDNRFGSIIFLFNKHTRSDFFKKIFYSSWLLVPFILILIYYSKKYLEGESGDSFSILCWFVEYQPDCKKDTLGELKLFALLYSILNFKYYYDYILSIFDNINNDVFQSNIGRRYIHTGLQYFTPLILFTTALVIFKELFVFKCGFRIAAENSFINIGSILDRRLLFLKDDFLVCYFLILDVCLWLMAYNFFKTISAVSFAYSSNRQKNLISGAQKNFRISMYLDIFVLSSTLPALFLIKDLQSMLAIQIIFLQFFYLWINITTIFNDFKFE